MAEGERIPQTIFTHLGDVKLDGSAEHPYEVKPGAYIVKALAELVDMARNRIPVPGESASPFHFSMSSIDASLDIGNHTGAVEYSGEWSKGLATTIANGIKEFSDDPDFQVTIQEKQKKENT